jgi:type VI secretion system protein ImpE
MTAYEHYQKGNLKDATTAALEDVKAHPSDSTKRGFLSELLCFTGDLERADRQLDALAQQNPDVMVDVSMFRQLIRAETARQQFYAEGRLPEFLDSVITPDLGRHLEAAVLLRGDKIAEAAELLAKAEEQRVKLTGTCDEKPFDDLRDVDELTASFFEVLTSTGKYFWIPLERVESVEFHPFETPRDLLWRRAHMVCRGGPDGEVFLPVLYAGSAAETDDRIRLGRATEWRGDEATPVRGFGQRIFLVGSDDRPILEMKELSIDAPATS